MNAQLCFVSKRILSFVFAILISIISFAQTKTVTGKVVNQQTNEPMQGVTVSVKGTTRSTITGVDGSFSISVPGNQSVLLFSNVGFASREVVMDQSGSYNVALTPGENKLDEVVVIGFGATKRRDLTGSVVSVKSAEITARPGPNPMESLQGRVAGLDITRSSGQPGAGLLSRILPAQGMQLKWMASLRPKSGLDIPPITMRTKYSRCRSSVLRKSR